MVILYTGEGKGKTTAALGQMVRVAGRGKSALMIQFIKGPWRSGEDDFTSHSGLPADRFEIRKRGRGFVGILGDILPLEEHRGAARAALAEFMVECDSGAWDLIVLDEVNVALSLGLVLVDEVLAAVKNYPKDRILILTGRGAAKELLDAADLVTEMHTVKHPFENGADAQAGVEF